MAILTLIYVLVLTKVIIGKEDLENEQRRIKLCKRKKR